MNPVLVIVALLVVGAAGIYGMWRTHLALNHLCAFYARRFCAKRGLEIRRVRLQPGREPSGLKTEFTLVQLDCADPQGQRRLVSLSVWAFGVRGTVGDEPYPDSYDAQWPEAAV
jgi:hypothetical protein